MNLEFLKKFNLNAYDLKALEYLINTGYAPAAVISREAEIPTSKIYIALSKLEQLGLVRLENTNPKVYALAEETQLLGALANLQQTESSNFSRDLETLSHTIANAAGNRNAAEHAQSVTRNYDEYLQKHLPRVAEAKQNIYTYWQTYPQDSQFIDRVYLPLFFGRRGVQHTLLSSTAVDAAHPVLKQIENRVTQANIGGNFHLWDGKYVLLITGNKYTGVFGSVLVQDAELYAKLSDAFMGEWFSAETV